MDEPVGQTTNVGSATNEPGAREPVALNDAAASFVEASRWIAGPDADPLRSSPWLTRPAGRRVNGRPVPLTRPLPRPRRFAPDTLGRRIRSALVLLCVLALMLGLAILALLVAQSLLGFSLPALPALPPPPALPTLPALPF